MASSGLDLHRLVKLIRIENVIFPLMALFVGAALSGAVHTVPTTVIWCAVIVFLLHSAVSVWNDMCDREIDAANGRPLLLSLHGTASYRLLFWGTLLAILLAEILTLFVLPVVTGLTLIALVASWFYNNTPYVGSRRPIASIVLLSFVGSFLPFLIGYSAGGSMQAGILWAIFWWAGRASVSILKDYKDAAGDARHSKKTFLLVFGARRVAYTSTSLFVIACIAIGVMGLLQGYHVAGAVLFFVLLAWIGSEHRQLFTHKSYHQLHERFIRLANYQLLIEGVLFVWVMQSYITS